MIQPKKEGNPATWIMHEPGGHYGKWNKPNEKDKWLDNITYLKTITQTHRSREWIVIDRSWEKQK